MKAASRFGSTQVVLVSPSRSEIFELSGLVKTFRYTNLVEIETGAWQSFCSPEFLQSEFFKRPTFAISRPSSLAPRSLAQLISDQIRVLIQGKYSPNWKVLGWVRVLKDRSGKAEAWKKKYVQVNLALPSVALPGVIGSRPKAASPAGSNGANGRSSR